MKKEVSSEFLPFLKVYKDGSVERFLDSPFVPPSDQDSATKNVVCSKDIRINSDVTARIYLPTNPSTPAQKLPVLAYFHGGGFIIESAFSFLTHRYINALVSQARVIVVSVEYRLAPENPLPAAYEDSWAALEWISSHSNFVDYVDLEGQNDPRKLEQWLLRYADFDRVFVGGDSSGANIAHNLSLRASFEKLHGGMKIHGVLLSHPFFLGPKPIGSDQELDVDDHGNNFLYKTWQFAYPDAPNGFENPLINPFSNEAPSLSGLQCSRLLVCVAEKDELRERGVRYFDSVKKSEWKGKKIELFEVEGEDHCFQVFNLDSDKSAIFIKRLALFLNSTSQSQGLLISSSPDSALN